MPEDFSAERAADVSCKEFAEKINLKLVYGEPEHIMRFVTEDVNRPGLQLAGFFDYFAEGRIQVLGKVEVTYLESLTDEARRLSLERYYSYKNMPCVIIARGTEYEEYPTGLLEEAERSGVPLFISEDSTTKLVHALTIYLANLLAPRMSLHGVLVDVYGVGVLIKGESGVGKSETALELVKRGHRLVADDVVEIRKLPTNELIGNPPAFLEHLMEIRGIGIVDVSSIYGMASVLHEKKLNLMVCFEYWDRGKQYERLGLDEQHEDLFGVSLDKLTLPVRPGRNLAVVIEVAALNWRQKRAGYNAAVELENRLSSL